jgi:hypothetical protein
MSKEKTPKIKRKTTGFDIVSRVITCVFAAAIPAALYFLNLIFYEFQSPLFQLISSLSGKTEDTGITYGYISASKVVKDIIPFFKSETSSENSFNAAELWAAFEPLHKAIYTTIALFAVAVVIVLVIFFISCFSNSKTLPLALSALGMIIGVSLAFAFRHVTAPIVSGDFHITGTVLNFVLGSIFGSSGGAALISTLASAVSDYVIQFTTINLSTAWVVMLICFFCIFIWNGAVLLMSLGEDKKEKKNPHDNK